MGSWEAWLYLAAVVVPLLAFCFQFCFIRALGRLNAYIATGAIAASLVLSLVGLVAYLAVGDPSAPWKLSWEWVALGRGLLSPGSQPLMLVLGIHIDSLAVLMFFMVCVVSTLIHVYSMGYMAEDPGYPRFFAFLSLFCFSMLGLVASSSIFQVFMFWELVGLCSYLLIGFWYEEKTNSDAANKAFIVNRIGDAGMIVGLGILFTALGTFEIDEINHGLRSEEGPIHVLEVVGAGRQVEFRDPETGEPWTNPADGEPVRMPWSLLTLAGLGIFAGCMGKSAQAPLHVWLPDAMAGPTPVSALIHAATMVAAGVYLVGRFYPLFTPPVLLTIAYVGALTLFLAATIAVVQSDYKKVLAYSTVSQLGFMMLGLGVGGWAAGLFHLLTHAFFKALLFLGAGSVYHAVHTYDLGELGGLRKKLPITSSTMLIATAAIAGVPLLSGFYSKDAILAAAIAFVGEPGHGHHAVLLISAAVGAFLTAFYMFRMWFLLFSGTSRSSGLSAGHGHGGGGGEGPDHGHGHGHGDDGEAGGHVHESPPVMTWPLVVLAFFAIIAGWPPLVIPFTGTPVLEHLLGASSPIHGAHHGGSAGMLAFVLSLVVAGFGIGLAALFYYYRKLDAKLFARRFGAVDTFLRKKWYFDELYDAALVKPTLTVARAVASFDAVLIDGFVHGLARFTAALSRVGGWFDLRFVDGLVNGIGKVVYTIGDVGRRVQTGYLRQYLMMLALGLIALFLGMFRWIQG